MRAAEAPQKINRVGRHRRCFPAIVKAGENDEKIAGLFEKIPSRSR
jgi:hypothetical protein